MKLRKVKPLAAPIHLLPGDTISVTYTEKLDSGEIVTQTKLIEDTVNYEIYAENVAILDIDAGDFLGYGKGIGGVLLENMVNADAKK